MIINETLGNLIETPHSVHFQPSLLLLWQMD